MFITLDGIDGCGKSTQHVRLVEALRAAGHDVTACRDPGSTPLGDAVRAIVLGERELEVGMRAEMLLYMAARAQLVEQVIQPALDAGQVVVSDRYLLANVVYQGYGGGLDVEELWSVGQVATGGLMPQVSFLLDVDVPTAASRRTGAADRMESRGDEFLQRVRDGFLTEARRRPQEIVVVDASRDADTIAEDILRIVNVQLQSNTQ